MLFYKTKDLIVRPMQARDYSAWKELHLNMPPPKNEWDKSPWNKDKLSRKDFADLLQNYRQAADSENYIHLAGIRKKDGAYVGHASLMNIVRSVSQMAYLGYGVFNPYWGLGYGKQLVRAALQLGFIDLQLHRIEAGIEPRNRRSLMLARSVGMRKEGLKKRCVFLRNHWVDLIIYSLTVEDLGLSFRGPKPRSHH